MAEKDQVHPLALSDYQPRIDDEDHDQAMSPESKLRRKKLCIQCCGCLTVLLLVPIVLIIVVSIVFHLRNPVIRTNSISIQRQLALVNGNTSHGQDQNMTILVDVSVKNPNYASFKYGNATILVYCHGAVVGEGWIPAGLAKARRTLRMNVSVDIIPKEVLSFQNSSDISSGTWNMSSYTIIYGKVKMLNIIKKNVAVQLNCTFSFSISTQAIQDSCRQHVQL